MTRLTNLRDNLPAKYHHHLTHPIVIATSYIEDQIELEILDMSNLHTSKDNRDKIKYLTKLRQMVKSVRYELE